MRNFIQTAREVPQNSNVRRIKVDDGTGQIEIIKGYYQCVNALNFWYVVGGNTQVHPVAWEKLKGEL